MEAFMMILGLVVWGFAIIGGVTVWKHFQSNGVARQGKAPAGHNDHRDPPATMSAL